MKKIAAFLIGYCLVVQGHPSINSCFDVLLCTGSDAKENSPSLSFLLELFYDIVPMNKEKCEINNTILKVSGYFSHFIKRMLYPLCAMKKIYTSE